MADLLHLIYHEQQEGQLCAQHALNSLLQGPYFTAVDLSEIARQLDQQEQNAMAEGEGGRTSDEFSRYMNEGSQNYDDSGFFSVQVLAKALEVWNLNLVPIKSRRMDSAKNDPAGQVAFILNLEEHWFTLRRFGHSRKRCMASQPEYVTETYLDVLLAQMKSDGYSIFVVTGELPRCDSDDYAVLNPDPELVIPKSKPAASAPTPGSFAAFTGTEYRLTSGSNSLGTSSSDEELAKAIAMSLDGAEVGLLEEGNNSDEELQKAIEMSLISADGKSSDHQTQSDSRGGISEAEKMRLKRLERFQKQ
ncbi:Ataxin-3 [Blyttiomyces sp. JEL0837]|nr:Ataxin-3 [Blyttiomyces sp. JEL0837]